MGSIDMAMVTRRAFTRMASGLAGALVGGAAAQARDGDPIQLIQARIENYYRQALDRHRANVGVVVGVVTPDNAGEILYAGRETLTNPFGKGLELDPHTLFEIGSTSKVFTSGIHYMLHGPYAGTLGSWLGSRMTMSRAVAGISLRNLALYRPGLAQDNQGGVYPARMMASLKNLFAYMANFTPPFQQGTCYAYSNIGWALLSMAALELDSIDTQEFAHAYNETLAKFCRGFSAASTHVFHQREAEIADGLHEGFCAVAVGERLPAEPRGRIRIRRHRQRRRRHDAAPAIQHGTPARRPDGPGARLPADRDLSGGVLFGQRGGAGDELRLVPCRRRNPARKGRGSERERRRRRVHLLDGIHALAGHGAPSSHGVFVLSNSPGSTMIGNNAMKVLLRG